MGKIGKKFFALCVILLIAFTFSACETSDLEEYKTAAKTGLEIYAQNKGEGNYTVEAWTTITELVTGGKTAVDAATNKSAVDAAITTTKQEIDAVPKEADSKPQSVFETEIVDGTITITGVTWGVSLSGSVIIPDDINGIAITAIGANAFQNQASCNEIHIPGGITSIDENAFGGCIALQKISVDSGNLNYSSQDGILYHKAKTSFIHIPQAIAGSVTIPSGIATISNNAFYDRTGLTSITFSNSLESIGSGAFWGCTGILDITIPGSVSNIGSYAFCECTNLTSVILSSGVGSIGESAFSGCSKIASLTVPGSVVSVGLNSFKNCTSIGNIVFQQGVSSIGEYAFSGCTGLTAVTIPQSVVSITSNTFASCPSLSTLTWYYNPNYSAIDLFINSFLTDIIFDSDTTTIGVRAFFNCSKITSITIPSGITSIGTYAFSNMSGLTQILIPSNVTSIDEYAFSACNSIKIYSEASSKPIGWDVDWNPQYRPVYYYSDVSKINCWRYVNSVLTLWII